MKNRMAKYGREWQNAGENGMNEGENGMNEGENEGMDEGVKGKMRARMR